MKKAIAILLAFCLCVALCACGKKDVAGSQNEDGKPAIRLSEENQKLISDALTSEITGKYGCTPLLEDITFDTVELEKADPEIFNSADEYEIGGVVTFSDENGKTYKGRYGVTAVAFDSDTFANLYYAWVAPTDEPGSVTIKDIYDYVVANGELNKKDGRYYLDKWIPGISAKRLGKLYVAAKMENNIPTIYCGEKIEQKEDSSGIYEFMFELILAADRDSVNYYYEEYFAEKDFFGTRYVKTANYIYVTACDTKTGEPIQYRDERSREDYRKARLDVSGCYEKRKNTLDALFNSLEIWTTLEAIYSK